MSRDLDLLTPYMKRKLIELGNLADKAGIPFIVTRTGSTLLEQQTLYLQGRKSLEEVNHWRAICKWAPITENQNRKVTWTLNSKHIINTEDLNFFNDHSAAFDIALKLGKYGVHWNAKADVNDNEIPDYKELGRLGEKIGLVWGGRFSTQDRPHFQQPENITGFEEDEQC